MSYTYDADGNITLLTDISSSSAAKTVNYTYDGLSRLTNASTTSVSSTPSYSQTFTYDALGNITSGPQGTYTYSTSTSSGFPNPDAVTSIVGSSTTRYTYDNNGSLLSTGTATDTWNYKNQLVQVVYGSGSSTYAYDFQGNRVELTESGASTVFPSQFYSAALSGAATTTVHIFADGLLLGTVEMASGTSAVRYMLDDNLGGTNVVTNASGTIVESLDYYPYGSTRVDSNTSSYGGEKRKYIGQYNDAGSGLDYLNARYYNASQGLFISQDPVFLGDPKSQLLQNPQSLNAYSYSEDNPINKSDPTGKTALALDIPAIPYGEAESGVAMFVGAPAIAISAAAIYDFATIGVPWVLNGPFTNETTISFFLNNCALGRLKRVSVYPILNPLLSLIQSHQNCPPRFGGQ